VSSTSIQGKEFLPVTDAKLIVADDIVVSLDYTLHLGDGEAIDTSTGREPLEFVQGQGQIVSGLEQALYGMTVGDEKKVIVAPIDGYGERDQDAFRVVPLDVFPPDMTLTPGQRLYLRDTRSGEVFEVYVDEVHPDSVRLDFNHPLAGETLHFHVTVSGLRPAADDELAHGHVHGPEHEH
jgi:FKBP-type peptidyl-prolyl cis-trans isomerase SlyD